MADALARLWTKFLPEIEQRLVVLEGSARAFAAGSLSDEQREEAHAAAHKLAGSLGTFGLQRGTELARQVELAFSGDAKLETRQLEAWVAELRMLIDQKR
jgi:HPt (histidine-containing phosphotransfer) domain-containing protein